MCVHDPIKLSNLSLYSTLYNTNGFKEASQVIIRKIAVLMLQNTSILKQFNNYATSISAVKQLNRRQ